MTFDMVLVLGLLVVVMAVLTAEWLSVDVVALAMVCVLVLAGVLTPAEAFAGFANEFIVVLCSIFVLSGAIVKTGVMEWLGHALHRLAGRSEGGTVGLVMGLSSAMSAFISNTNSTAILTPAVVELARKGKTSPSKLLIPLAYASMLGGACTVIGTSTNLAANGMIQRLGLEPFSLFEFAPIGLTMIVACTLYMVLAGRHWLPTNAPATLSEEFDVESYLSEIELQEGSELVGKTLRETRLGERGVEVLALVRDGRKRTPGPGTVLKEGDALVVEATKADLLAVDEDPGVRLEAVSWHEGDLVDGEHGLAEAIVMPRSALLGRTLRDLRFRQRFNASVLAVYRHGRAHATRISKVRFRVGDTLLLRGKKDELVSTEDLRVLGAVDHVPFAKRKGGLALGALLGAVVLGGTGLVPLSIALLAAALFVVLTRLVGPDEVYGLIEWPLIVLIGAMTSVGLALEKTEAADWLANGLATVLMPLGITAVLAALALLTMVLTQPMSNAAAALVVLPIAVSTATQVGVDPRGVAVLVTLAASLSFVAPLEPACLLVHAAGRYRFRDFVLAGLPMTAITLVVLLLLVPVVWPLS